MKANIIQDSFEVRNLENIKKCPTQFVLAVNDTLNVISGKWKLPIIGSLLFGKKRFKEMEKSIPKITPRMLSKELKELEINGIVSRTVYNTIPLTVEYELTDAGKKVEKLINVIVEWGIQHRKNMLE
jgi:DNA-binding HxlR family transcriptional regulator